MHWTTLSDAEIFAMPQATSVDGSTGTTEEITVGHAVLVVTRAASGEATISRVISPRASDYLRPEWQPGMPFDKSSL